MSADGKGQVRHAGGMHLQLLAEWMGLPDALTEERHAGGAVAACLAEVGLYGVRVSVTGEHLPGLVLGYAYLGAEPYQRVGVVDDLAPWPTPRSAARR